MDSHEIEIITTTTFESKDVSLIPPSERVSIDSKPNFTISDEENEKSKSNDSKKRKNYIKRTFQKMIFRR